MKIGQIMHDVLVVPETKSLLDLLVNSSSASATWRLWSTNLDRPREW
jgi:hypothetical protein